MSHTRSELSPFRRTGPESLEINTLQTTISITGQQYWAIMFLRTSLGLEQLEVAQQIYTKGHKQQLNQLWLDRILWRYCQSTPASLGTLPKKWTRTSGRIISTPRGLERTNQLGLSIWRAGWIQSTSVLGGRTSSPQIEEYLRS